MFRAILVILGVIVLYLPVAYGQTEAADALMKFDKETLELGEVRQGDKRTFEYRFTNIGNEDIKIDLVSGCDCTTLDWPRLPIRPGEQGVISVIFDSTEKEDSEPVDIDVYLANLDPKTGHPVLKILNYTFKLVR